MPAQVSNSTQIYGKDANGFPQPVGISTPVAATGALTISSTVTDGETFSFTYAGSVYTYTWKTTLDTAANQIAILSTPTLNAAAAASALNRTTGEGVTYSSATTVNPLVSATSSLGVLTVTALTAGTAANNITLAETMANGAWGAANMAGGAYGSLTILSTPGANTSTTAATLAQAYKTVASTGTPEAAGSGLVESVTFTAQKNRTTANTGNVWIGFSATNDTQLRLLVPGDSITYTAPDGKKLDLAVFYIDVATNGDGVLYETGN